MALGKYLRAAEVERAYANTEAVFWIQFPLFHFCNDGVVVAFCGLSFAVHQMTKLGKTVLDFWNVVHILFFRKYPANK